MGVGDAPSESGRVVGLPEVLEITGLSREPRSGVRVRDGSFPPAIRLGGQGLCRMVVSYRL